VTLSPKGAGPDEGVSLVELTVSLALMSIAMMIFTTGIMQLFNGANKNEALSNAQSQVNTTFLKLDKEIRYATGISAPDQVGGDWYVEYLITNTGTQICTQLRLTAGGRLQHRTWTKPASAATPPAPAAWTPLAERVEPPGGGTPFTLLPADAVSNFHRLRLTLVARDGNGGTGTRTASSIMFTALNTSLSTTSAGTCTEGRAIP
jgi:hypothetical protein